MNEKVSPEMKKQMQTSLFGSFNDLDTWKGSNNVVRAKFSYNAIQSRAMFFITSYFTEEELKNNFLEIPLARLSTSENENMSGKWYTNAVKSIIDLYNSPDHKMELINEDGDYESHRLFTGLRIIGPKASLLFDEEQNKKKTSKELTTKNSFDSAIGDFTEIKKTRVFLKFNSDLVSVFKASPKKIDDKLVMPKEGYTEFLLRNISELENKYSYRLYSFAAQRIKLKEESLYVETFCDYLKLTGQNRRKPRLFTSVIEPAIKEINKLTDIHISFSHSGRGQSMKLHFKYKRQPHLNVILDSITNDKYTEQGGYRWCKPEEYQALIQHYQNEGFIKYVIDIVTQKKNVVHKLSYTQKLLQDKSLRREYAEKESKKSTKNFRHEYESQYKKIAYDLFEEHKDSLKDEFYTDIRNKPANFYPMKVIQDLEMYKDLDINGSDKGYYIDFLIRKFNPVYETFDSWFLSNTTIKI